MKKFQFKLDPLLRLRRQHEEQKQRLVSELLSRINHEQQEALALNEAIRAQGDILRAQRQAGRVDLHWYAQYRSYVTHMRQAIEQRIENVRRIQRELVLARHELTEAAKQTKILEKLKERRQERHAVEQRRADHLAMDEIGANLFRDNVSESQENRLVS